MGEHGEFADGLPDEWAESLADRICHALTREPYLSRLATAIAQVLSHTPGGQPPGMMPIGPYEIPPEFGNPVWADEPQQVDDRAAGSLAGPQVFPRRGRPEADRDL